MNKSLRVWIVMGVVLIAAGGYLLYRGFFTTSQRSANVLAFIRSPQDHPDWMVESGERCAGAPFSQPTHGMIGYLWGDSFRIGQRHQGLDIFGGTDPGRTPVFSAYAGYLTREAGWISSLIIRIPRDPLVADRQIWTYYTHMADAEGNSFISPDFPPGTAEVFVDAGTLLGYQGNYSGDPANPTGIHLHFSIVLDNGDGTYLNELEIQNTLDPTPYFNLPLNAAENPSGIPVCPAEKIEVGFEQ